MLSCHRCVLCYQESSAIIKLITCYFYAVQLFDPVLQLKDFALRLTSFLLFLYLNLLGTILKELMRAFYGIVDYATCYSPKDRS